MEEVEISSKKIDVDLSDKYVKWLNELDKSSGAIVGGKGANLAEMFNAGFPVPPAFVVTSVAFTTFIEKAGLKQKISDILENTDVDNTEELDKNVSKIRSYIIEAKMPEDMQKEIIEAYEHLGADKAVEKAKESRTISSDALDILKNSHEPVFVAVRSSATTEDLATASFAGQQDTYTNVKGNDDLIKHVKRCFASLYTSRATYYRKKKGFKEGEALLAVVVQKMINSDKSGVIFTRNPVSQKEELIIESVFGLGEGIVSGKVKPDHHVVSKDLKIVERKIAIKKTAIIREASGKEKEIELNEEKSKQQVLTNSEITQLAEIAMKIDHHYKKPQDIEFAVDSGELYIVQSRPITTLEVAGKDQVVHGDVLLTGLGASPGISSGRVKIIKSMNDLSKVKEGDVLVTKMTNPDMVVTMQRSSAIVTDEGGATAHAAIVSREMGIPAVVGTEDATTKLKDGDIVTVDGTKGKVHEGSPEGGIKAVKKEVLPVVKGTKVKIKVIVDLPEFAERAAKSQVDAVGLMRLEGIIASSGKHPVQFLNDNNTEEYTELLSKGIKDIAEHFKEVWIRASDIRSDEYRNLKGAPQEVELNPMLGFHGIRFSLKNLPLFKAELEAVKRVAIEHPDKKFGIMFPQVISEEEMKETFNLFRAHYQRDNLVIGAMIETPAAVQIIRDICKYVKFISFGTNDLTQYTLAIDRGNSDVQYIYDEMHPAVLRQIRRVINICKEYNVETSICGQAGSKKEMVQKLIKYGIDSISVNADMANELSKYILGLEGRVVPEEKQENETENKEGENNEEVEEQIEKIDDLENIEDEIEDRKDEVMEDKAEKEAEAGETIIEETQEKKVE